MYLSTDVLQLVLLIQVIINQLSVNLGLGKHALDSKCFSKHSLPGSCYVLMHFMSIYVIQSCQDYHNTVYERDKNVYKSCCCTSSIAARSSVRL